MAPRTPKQKLLEVLRAAVADMTVHGFDSATRVEYWVSQIRQAAVRASRSEADLQQLLERALGTVFRRLVDRGGVRRYHPGVSKFTIEKLRPEMRRVLDRHIYASAQLIRLNRTRRIEETLKRFQGWSTSIPDGGSRSVHLKTVVEDIHKPTRQEQFEERRVLIDQGHKLASSISSVVATDGGAIAAEWHSHYRQAGYDYREHHKERDGRVYLVRGSWAEQAGLVKPGAAGYLDKITQPGEEVYCRCFVTWIYSPRRLPDDMLTAKGRATLAQSPFSRADAESGDEISIDEAEYERRLADLRIDWTRDVQWMSCLDKDCSVLFVDSSLPHVIENNNRPLQTARPLMRHEVREWMHMRAMVDAWRRRHGTEPSGHELQAIYLRSHYLAGNVAEREWLLDNDYSPDEWNHWCAGELSRLENRQARNPPPHADVRLVHDRRKLHGHGGGVELEAAL